MDAPGQHRESSPKIFYLYAMEHIKFALKQYICYHTIILRDMSFNGGGGDDDGDDGAALTIIQANLFDAVKS